MFYKCPQFFEHILLQASPELCSDRPSHTCTTDSQEHLVKLHNIIAGNWKMTPDKDIQPSHHPIEVQKRIKNYLSASRIPLFLHKARTVLNTDRDIWAMPNKTVDIYTHPMVHFYLRNSDQIQKEHPRILSALRTIEYASYTVHPLRTCLWSQHGTPILAPELSKLEEQHEKWFSDCDINLTPARESLNELSQIEDHVSDLWLTTSETPTNNHADPHDALEAAQSSLKESQTPEKITSYVYTMALLVHSSKKALEHLLHMFSLWAEIGETHSGDLLRDMDTRAEVISCSTAIFNAQNTWNELMKCPWTVACALHLITDPYANPEGVEEAEDKDKGDILQVLNNDRVTTKELASVLAAVGICSVQSMLKSCFKLDSVLRQQNEAHAIIKAFTGGMAGNQSDKKLVRIEFISDQGKHRIDKMDVVQFIREYWKEEALLNTDKWSPEGFDILSALADTPELLQHHFHMNLDSPKVHPECILAQHLIDNPQRINQAIPAIGLSRYACGTCKLFLQAVSKEVLITGTKDAFCVCMVPEQSLPNVKEEVANQLSCKLQMQLGSIYVRSSLRKQLEAALEKTR